MNIPLRIVQERKLYPDVRRFSFLLGLKTLWFNVKTLTTSRVMAGTQGWYEIKGHAEIVDDVSLVFKDGKAEFIKTPADAKEAALEITQNI